MKFIQYIIRIRIRQLVRTAGRAPTVDERQDIERKRQRIAGRIRDFHTSANRLLGTATVNPLIGVADTLNDDGYISDEVRRSADRGLVPRLTEIENHMLVFPSAQRGPLLQRYLICVIESCACAVLKRMTVSPALGRR